MVLKSQMKNDWLRCLYAKGRLYIRVCEVQLKGVWRGCCGW